MDDSRILELFGDDRNADPVRLSVLGFACVEETLMAGLDEAFDGELPPELRRVPFKARVALAVALNILPTVFSGPLGRLAEVRNRFAHGNASELTVSDARNLYAACRELAPEIDEMAPSLRSEEQGEIQLANLLLMVEIGMLASFEEARERRQQGEEAMREWWQRRARKLTEEEIAALWESDDSESDSDRKVSG